MYQLPFRSGNRLLETLMGGWQLSGVGSYLSGAPFSPSVGFASTGTGAYTPRPDLVAGCKIYPDEKTLSNWFNTDCFTPPPVGTFGNAGRNILIGPDSWNIDGSLSKDFKAPSVSEDFAVQFRAEFFNLTNHPSFGNPNGNLYSQGPNGAFLPNASGNRVTSTISQPRQIQFGLKIRY